MILLLDGLLAAVPSRDAVASLDRGRADLNRSRYQLAERDFADALSLEPLSLYARVGLACAFLHEGHGSRALLELTLALERGLFPPGLGGCGGGLGLDGRYFAAKYGATGAFMAPHPPKSRAIESQLLQLPLESEDDEARRMLLGSCLAFRAGLDGAGWYYAANGAELGVPAAEVELLPSCLGDRLLAHLGCAAGAERERPDGLLNCILNGRAGFAYQRERSFLYPADDPRAYSR